MLACSLQRNPSLFTEEHNGRNQDIEEPRGNRESWLIFRSVCKTSRDRGADRTVYFVYISQYIIKYARFSC